MNNAISYDGNSLTKIDMPLAAPNGMPVGVIQTA